jgi:RNA polymerase sigma-70 factor (ECF subfamily)
VESVQVQAESEWVRKIRTGDGEAFEQLFRFYGQLLIHFVRRYVQETSIAENLVQDVFLAIWSNRSQLDPAQNIKTYLYTAAKNQALKHLRHSDVERRSAAEVIRTFPRPQTPADEWQEKEIAAAVHQAIEALPEKCRILFSMNRFDHLTYAEIAEIQDISIKTVETQMGRALKFLRNRLAHLL